METKNIIFEELAKILDKQVKDISEYIDLAFTKEEANRHSDNLQNMILNSKETLAFLKMKLLANG